MVSLCNRFYHASTRDYGAATRALGKKVQGNMTIPIGSVSLTVNTPGIFSGAPTMGAQGIVISNESPFNVSINLQGTSKGGTLLPETVDFFPIVQGFNGNVTYSPTSIVTNPASYTAARLSFEVVGANESVNRSAYPIALTRPAVTPTATGNPLFTARFGLGSSANNVQTLNVFNPANSGTDLIFHAAKVFTNSPGVPQAVLTFIAGADLNLATAVTPGSHIAQANPPVSVAHCSADDAAVGHGGTTIETGRTTGSIANATTDLLAFPDTVTLKPGCNLLLVCSDTSASHTIQLALKWSEQTAIPAPSLAGVPILTAANIVNDTSGAGTGIIESTVSGDSTSAVFITNDAQFTLGSVAHPSTIKSRSGTNLTLDTNAGTDSIQLKNNGTLQAQVDNTGLSLQAGTLKFLLGSISKISFFSATASAAGTVNNHGLGVIPDIILMVLGTLHTTVHVYSYEESTMTSTQVTMYADVNLTGLRCIAFKF